MLKLKFAFIVIFSISLTLKEAKTNQLKENIGKKEAKTNQRKENIGEKRGKN